MGLPAARITDLHVCPTCPPPGLPIITGWFTVLTAKLPQARITDICTCTGKPDPIVTGAWTVLVGKLPAARITDSTAAGGKVVTGWPTVLIGTKGAGGGGGSFGAGLGLTSTMSPECVRLADAFAKAQMAGDTYGGDNELPENTRRATDAELLGLGVTAQMLDPPDSDFHARVYVTDGPTGPEYTVAFRGTQSADDVVADVSQGLGFETDHYERAIAVATAVSDSADNVNFSGHSLGGGLASAAAVATGRSATTFNAAGVSNSTVEDYSEDPVPVDAYYTPRDPLSAAQDNREGVLATIVAGLSHVNMPLGAMLGAYTAGREMGSSPMLPQAYGTRHELPETRDTSNQSVWDRINPVNALMEIADPHRMTSVMDALEAQQRESGCI